MPRLADWLAEPANAALVAAEVANAAVALADAVRDEDVHRAFEDVIRKRADAVPLAPLAGKALRFLTEDGRHVPVVDMALRGLDRYLDDHRLVLRQRLGRESPWWLPGAVEDRIFERLLDGVRSVIRDMAANPEHQLRRDFDARLVALASELESSPTMLARGEQLKHDVLAQPELREWIAGIWQDVKRQLRAQASDPASELRGRLAAAIGGVGRRLREDPVLAARVENGLETGVAYVVEHFKDEMAGLVTSTIARWNPEETANRLELLLGSDLQYVRINGTVVGAGAGLVLHVVSQVLS